MARSMRLRPLSSEFSRFIALSLIILLFSPLLSSGSGSQITGMGNTGATLMNDIVWRSTARLTWLGNSTHPDIMRSGDGNYNIVWQDHRNGNWEIYYLRVRPDGFKLVNDSRITYFSGDDINPVLGVYGSHIYIVWQRYVGGHWAIYFSRLLYSNRNILIEIHPVPITKVSTNCINPRIAVDSKGYIHVVWQEWNNSNWEVMYDELNPYGQPVFPPVDVSNTVTPSLRPQIVVDNDDNVHVFWIEYTPTPGYSVFYRKIGSNGKFLTESRRISVVSPNSTIDSYFYNDSLYTVFSCSRERLAYEVIFTRLSSSGYTEVDDTNLTVADRIDSIDPHVAVIHNRMFVVWDDYPRGVIRFSIFDENGNPIGQVMNISSSASFYPSISVNDKTIGIVWQKKVGNETFLYFRSAEFPDLKVNSLSLHAEGANVTIESQLSSTVPLRTECGIYLDGKLVINSTVYVSESTMIRETLKATPGWHQVEVYIDPFNRIIESNESNNFMVGRVYVKHYSFNLTVNPVYEAPAGRWINLSALIENTGNWQDNYTLRLRYNRTLFRVSPSMLVLHLESGESEIVNFTLYTFRTTVVGNYTLNLSATSLTTGCVEYRNVTVKVLPYVNFKLEYVPVYYVVPGNKISMDFIIQNTGNCNDTYLIRVDESKNWPMVYGNMQVNVSYRSSGHLNLTLLVPNGTYGYTRNFVNLTVKSSKLNISMNASVLVVVKPVHKASAYVVSMVRNGTYYYSIRIKVVNTGNMKDLFNIVLGGQASKRAYASPSSLLLAPMESAIVTVNSYLPPYMPAGSYKLLVQVYYQNRSLASVPILLTVEGNHQFIVKVQKLSEGKKVVLFATVRNVGNTPELVEILPQLMKKINATWVLEYKGKNYTNITTVYVPQNATVNVTITLHTKLPNGIYRVEIIFRSASHITKNVTVEFRVGEKSIWEKMSDFIMEYLTYIVIAVVVIVGIVVYMIKFRE